MHHRILYFVGRNPGIAINALLDILGVTKQALNAPLRRLVEMKLVAVRTAARDRRYRELRLTRDGARLEAQLTGTQMAHLAAVFAAAGKERRSRVARGDEADAGSALVVGRPAQG